MRVVRLVELRDNIHALLITTRLDANIIVEYRLLQDGSQVDFCRHIQLVFQGRIQLVRGHSSFWQDLHGQMLFLNILNHNIGRHCIVTRVIVFELGLTVNYQGVVVALS